MHGTTGDNGRTWLYKYYNKNGRLLYIGASSFPLNRMWHTNRRYWGEEILTAWMKLYPTRLGALRAEKKAIENEKPKYNIVHATNGNHSAHGKVYNKDGPSESWTPA